ncbi:RNA polymerase sigma factor [Pedobacter sp. L105]|uniref:RNA polymerase sigma factor n=1 Tax=Pedobacter sp. L105 TaxID=1641871 RepID=UPI00131AEB40|nr:RNA polymerase sigma-70 factor [Pedobacter sp. L105]
MTAYSKHSDYELASLLKEGNHTAFTEIYHRYKGVLYIHALKLLKDEDEAQDVIHELYTSLWNKSKDFNLDIPLRAYLYRAVKNRIFDIFAHQKIRAGYIEKLAEVIDRGEWVTDEKIREKELIAAIEAGLDLLPPKMREVFEMSRFANLSHKEIGRELNISDKTVKTQVHNALQVLRLKINSFLAIL